MISSSKSKFIRSLHHKKYRDQHRLFVVEGEKMVMELVSGGAENPFKIRELIATPEWLEGHMYLMHGGGAELTQASQTELKKCSKLVTPQPVMALVSIPHRPFQVQALLDTPVLALESIRDPGNLGTIIRTADWFGIRHILCSPDSADLYNHKVVQSTMGAITRVQVSYLDLKSLLETGKLREKTVFGTFMQGRNIYETPLEPDPLIFFGNESHGLSAGISALIAHRITIPSFSSSGKGSESLNVASSVAVVCSEIRRR